MGKQHTAHRHIQHLNTMNMQLVHRNTLRKFRRQVKQISLILKNRGITRWTWEEELDDFSATLLAMKQEIQEAIANLTQNTYPWDYEIPTPQKFRDAEDAKKHFNNIAFDYNNWLDALNAYRPQN